MSDSMDDAAPSQPRRVVNLGLVGLGVGAARILPRIESDARIQLVAGADIDPGVRDAFRARHGLPAYQSMDELCAHADVDAVWIATPDRFHCQHAVMAAEHGKHVIVEKPMATSLAEAEAMVAAAQTHGVALVCGHTHAYSSAIRTMLGVIRSGEIGALCAVHAFSYTDWILRPRTASELDPASGGVVARQGPHQIDTVRLLGGGLVRSVRAMTGQWMPERSIPGYYCALLAFEDGTPAMLTYNGYGYFVTNELVPWGTQRARYQPEERLAVRRALRQGTRDEVSDKREMGIGGVRERDVPGQGQDQSDWLPGDLGVVVASCERGDMRHSRHGIYVYDDRGRTEYLGGGAGEILGEMGHDALDELYHAVVHEQPIVHGGAWGMATLEVCLAIQRSAREQKEILLSHQIATPWRGHND